MDGQGGDNKQKTKPHGNPYPKRGEIMKQIIKDLTGGGNDNDSSSSGGRGDAGGGSATPAGYYGAY